MRSSYEKKNRLVFPPHSSTLCKDTVTESHLIAQGQSPSQVSVGGKINFCLYTTISVALRYGPPEKGTHESHGLK